MRTCWAGWGMWLGVLIEIFYFWLLWVFIAACSLSLAAASRGYFSLRCMGFSLWWLLLLGSTGSKACGLQKLQWVGSLFVVPRPSSTGSIVVVHQFNSSHDMWDPPGPRIKPRVSSIARQILYHWATKETSNLPHLKWQYDIFHGQALTQSKNNHWKWYFKTTI